MVLDPRLLAWRAQQSRYYDELFNSPQFEKFRERYQSTASSRGKLAEVVRVVRDSVFWENLREIVRLLDPKIIALRQLEADHTFASGVYKWFRFLVHHQEYSTGVTHLQRRLADGVAAEVQGAEAFQALMQVSRTTSGNIHSVDDCGTASESANLTLLKLDELRQHFRLHMMQRWQYVHTNAMGVAFLLDPTTDLDDFGDQDEDHARQQACSMALRTGIVHSVNELPALMREITEFASMKTLNGSDFRVLYSATSPKSYWVRARKRFPILGRLADIVFAIPTSSAASERAWSILDHIHTKKRNRLSVDKVSMLAFIYINHGVVNAETVDMARHLSRPQCFEDDLC